MIKVYYGEPIWAERIYSTREPDLDHTSGGIVEDMIICHYFRFFGCQGNFSFSRR
jgi:hypothetical protein